MQFISFIKKLIVFDVLWGKRSKILAGIKDGQNKIESNIVINSLDNSITFPTVSPDFLQPEKYFRIFGGTNDSTLFRVKQIIGNKVILYETPIDDSGVRIVDARLWVVHNDTAISKEGKDGNTIFNVHNKTHTNLEDGSKLALAYAEHYHDDDDSNDDDIGEIVTHKKSELGGFLMASDSYTNQQVPIGPLVVIDRRGDVIYAKKSSFDDYNVDYNNYEDVNELP